VDPATLNQLSREKQGRDMGNYRASPQPPPKQAPQASRSAPPPQKKPS
jgi:hypothetical protein